MAVRVFQSFGIPEILSLKALCEEHVIGGFAEELFDALRKYKALIDTVFYIITRHYTKCC